ncbi:amino acid permease [Thermonema rossianum]|uniref:amino acid permease n=1 Tax=Thermonema rossianum TaxID=55505 RepID=UPI00068AB89D|nr:amino acid permease [Thermonema rossianum]
MKDKHKFGTFGGVFTPSILTILGVIMYLRLPMIVGTAGLWSALGIVLVAHLISLTTGLSVASIATDKKVATGGTYYIISRSLGLPIGGTLGLALFVGLSFSVSLYLIGFAESFLSYWGWPTDINTIRITGTIMLIAVTVVTFISSSLAIKTQYFIMAAIFLSLISIFMDGHPYKPEAPNLEGFKDYSWIVLFGIFFPAVTGFEAGVSMSGDLRDPKRSIPVGTIMAIAVGLLVYIALVFFFAYTVDARLLAEDPQALLKIARVPELVVAGIWGATLSSALGSILGAPRILQSTAMDGITPKFFAKGHGKGNEPRNALLLAFVIAEAGILIGELDVIARIVSTFFITTYGFLNLSAAFERMTSTDFRPSFKVPAWVSWIGVVACLVVMIQLDIMATVGGILILGAVYLFLKRRQLELKTGDTWGSVWASLVKRGMAALSKEKNIVRNWRPNVLLFAGKQAERPLLFSLGLELTEMGTLFAFEMMPGSKEELATRKTRELIERDDRKLFLYKYDTPNIFKGIEEVARVYGAPGIEPNTVMLGWSKQPSHRAAYLDLLRHLLRYDYNLLLLNAYSGKGTDEKQSDERPQVDVWVPVRGREILYFILLMRHLTANWRWKDAHLRFLTLVDEPTDVEVAYRQLALLSEEYRLDFEIKVIYRGNRGKSDEELWVQESTAKDLVLMPLPPLNQLQSDEEYARYSRLADLLKAPVLLGTASSQFEEAQLLPVPVQTDLGEEAGQIYDWVLPEEPLSAMPEVQQRLRSMEQVYGSMNRLLFERIIEPILLDYQNGLEEIARHIDWISKESEKAHALPEAKRQRFCWKLRNQYLFRQEQFVEQFVEQHLDLQQQRLEAATEWYMKELQDLILGVPKEWKLTYPKEKLLVAESDTAPVRRLKRRLRWWAAITGKKAVTYTVDFREVARHFLYQQRIAFFNVLLESLQYDLLSWLKQYRNMNAMLNETLLDIEAGNNDWKGDLEAVSAETEKLKKRLLQLRPLYYRRAAWELRKALKNMGRHIEEIGGDKKVIRTARRFEKRLEEYIENIAQYPKEYTESAKLTLSANLVDLHLQLVKVRVQEKTLNFYKKERQHIENHTQKTIERILQWMRQEKSKEELLPALQKEAAQLQVEEWTQAFEIVGQSFYELCADLPEEVEMAGEFHIRPQDMIVEVESLELPLRRLATHFLASKLSSVVEEFLKEVSAEVMNATYALRSTLSLLRFNVENIDAAGEEEAQAQYKALLHEAALQVEKIQTDLSTYLQSAYEKLNHILHEHFEPLSAHRIVRTHQEFAQLYRLYQGKKMLSKTGRWLEQVKDTLRKLLEKVVYSQSRVLLATQKQEQITAHTTTNQLADWVEQLTPRPQVGKQLSAYYHNLFSGQSNIGDDFWIPRPHEEAALQKAVLRFKAGNKGLVFVVGHRDSGKTAICRRIVQNYFSQETVFHVFASNEECGCIEGFTKALARATGLGGDLVSMLEALPWGSACIINDIEQWWQEAPEAAAEWEQLIHTLYAYSHRCLFVLNTNPYAFRLMNHAESMSRCALAVLQMQPYTAQELQELVMRRHRTTGYRIVWSGREERRLSGWRLAQLFNKYFLYSAGNPGITLNAWIAHIDKVQEKELHIRAPQVPSITVLDKMPPLWKAILWKVLQHKQLSKNALLTYFPQERREECLQALEALLRTGVLVSRGLDTYAISIYVVRFVIQIFEKEEL